MPTHNQEATLQLLPTGKGKSISSNGVSLPLLTTHQGRSSHTTQNEFHLGAAGGLLFHFAFLDSFCFISLLLVGFDFIFRGFYLL